MQKKKKYPILLIVLGHPNVLNHDATSFQTILPLPSSWPTIVWFWNKHTLAHTHTQSTHTHTQGQNPNLCCSLVRSVHLSRNGTSVHTKDTPHADWYTHKIYENRRFQGCGDHTYTQPTHTYARACWCENSGRSPPFTLHSDPQTEDYTRDNLCVSVCLWMCWCHHLTLRLRFVSTIPPPKKPHLIVWI